MQKKTVNYNNKNELQMILESVNWITFYSNFTKNIRGTGEWLSSTCPFHGDRNNSFSFNQVNGAWKCFAGCGSGNGFKIVQRIFNLNFKQSVELIKGENLFVS